MIFNRLKVLSDDEVIRIVEAAINVLKRTGVRFEDEPCMNDLESVGCEVDRTTQVVKFTEDVIFDAMDSVPSVTPPDDLPKARVCSANKGMILDYHTRQMRPGRKDDVEKVITLCNALDNITLASAGVVPEDVPNGAVEVYNTGMLLKYSEKLFNQWVYDANNVPLVLEMGRIVTGGAKELRESMLMSYMLNSITPLRYPTTQLKIARQYAGQGLPIIVASMPQSGSTAPATAAGTLVVATAELLAGLVWVYSLKAGVSVGMGAFTQLMDMRSGNQLYAGPEQTAMFLGAHQIIRYLGYTSGNTSFETDSCDFDMQNGWEKAFSGVMSWAAGVDMFGQAGFLMDGYSMEQLVLDNEAVGMINKVGQGVIVDEDSLAFDTTKSVGAAGSNFLGERHTMKHARDFWLPDVFPRVSFEQWKKEGARHILDIAHEKVEKILQDNSLTLQISDEQARAIDEIVDRRIAETAGGVN